MEIVETQKMTKSTFCFEKEGLGEISQIWPIFPKKAPRVSGWSWMSLDCQNTYVAWDKMQI